MDKLPLPESLQAFVAEAKRGAAGSEEWQQDYAAGRLPEALAGVEAELAENPDAAGARLWWVLVQLEVGRVPLTALASPLLEILPALKADPSLHRLSLLVLLSLVGKLAEKGQLRLGASVVDAAAELGEQSGLFGGRALQEMHEYLVSYLNEELTRARSRRESPDYIRRLEKKIDEKKAHKVVIPPEPKAPRPRKNSLSSKRLFEEALAADSGAHSAVAAIDARPIEVSSSPAASSPSRNFSPFVLGGMVVIALAFLFARGLGALFDAPLDSEPGMLLAMNTTTPSLSPLRLPDVSLDRHALLSEKMRNINSNLQQVGERLKNLETKTPSDPAFDPSVDQAALKASEEKLEQITSKPEDELVPLDGPKPAATAAPVDPRRVPRLDPAGVAQVKIEDLGSITPPLGTPAPELKKGSDGRLYGPPADRDIAIDARGPNGEGRALDGTPLRSYEVEQFERPILYRTIVPTNVLTSPSLLSTAVTRLDRDTSVQVVSKMGQWLELRSAQGRKGYIYAQDAVPAGQ